MISAQPASGEPQPPTLTLTAAFEGIEGSYSHAVLEAYAARRGVSFAPLGCSSYRGVAHAVLSGRADLGLLPIDNAIAGTIREGYDVLAEYELDLLAEITWRSCRPPRSGPFPGVASGARHDRRASVVGSAPHRKKPLKN